ncbi:developmental transcriptional regulator BldC [Marinactinospora endophytica]
MVSVRVTVRVNGRHLPIAQTPAAKWPELLTTIEVADLCRVAPSTVGRWLHEGRLHGQRTLGGHWRIPADQIRALLEGDQG